MGRNPYAIHGRDGRLKAPALVIALGKGKGSKEPESEPEMDGGDEDKTAAAQLVLDALEAKDAEALSEALSAHYAMCGE